MHESQHQSNTGPVLYRCFVIDDFAKGSPEGCSSLIKIQHRRAREGKIHLKGLRDRREWGTQQHVTSTKVECRSARVSERFNLRRGGDMLA